MSFPISGSRVCLPLLRVYSIRHDSNILATISLGPLFFISNCFLFNPDQESVPAHFSGSSPFNFPSVKSVKSVVNPLPSFVWFACFVVPPASLFPWFPSVPIRLPILLPIFLTHSQFLRPLPVLRGTATEGGRPFAAIRALQLRRALDNLRIHHHASGSVNCTSANPMIATGKHRNNFPPVDLCSCAVPSLEIVHLPVLNSGEFVGCRCRDCPVPKPRYLHCKIRTPELRRRTGDDREWRPTASRSVKCWS